MTLDFDREDIALRVLFEVGGGGDRQARSLRRKLHAQAAKIVARDCRATDLSDAISCIGDAPLRAYLAIASSE